MKYATRLNSFLRVDKDLKHALEAIGKIDGVDCVDMNYPEHFAVGADLLFWPVYVCWTQEEWENGGKKEYAEQAQKCCRDTLYINSVCEGDAFGGATYFRDGNILCELPIFNEGLLLAEV